ncbi:MAG: hypothetical protein HY392_00085 [Candidatus Diapherotrites archaeon]|nr:hypothetical protein [Candidatus Diapherotrites archaeon]
MGFFSKARRALKGIAEKVLYVDDTSPPLAQINALEDYLGRYEFDLREFAELSEFMGALKKKHMVDSICVASSNGSLIASTNGEDLVQALTGTALFNYVQSELPKSEALLVKSNGWYMVLPFRNKIFIIKSLDALSTPEMKAIARDLEDFVAKKQ